MRLLECHNLSKRFSTLTALEAVSFALDAGEVVGLVGRSGAGKSVLVEILSGLTAPTAGEVWLGGRPVHWPFAAATRGVAVVLQQPQLAEELDTPANIFLGGEPGWPARLGWLRLPRRRQIEGRTRELLAELDMTVEPLTTPVKQLSSEQHQLIAIARALRQTPQLVILDEPTALLSYGAQQRLLALIRRWRAQGAAVLFCSSGLDHIFAVTDRVVVLNEGRKVLDTRTDSTSREAVVAALVGNEDRQQLTPMIWALESYRSAREQAERLGHQQQRLEQDLAAQDSLNQQLIAQLAEQVRSLDRANLALQDAQRRLLTEREHERKSLARELHDQVIQDLLSLNFQLEDLEQEPTDSPATSADLADVRAGLRALVADVRQICGNLRPPTIDSLGLTAALQSYAREWSARADIRVDLQIAPEIGRLPEAIELSVFRIVQESLANVRKHAHAQRVTIRLWPSSPRAVGMAIEDDGRGLSVDFDLAALAGAGHYGLLGISERLALVQGKLRITNGAQGGMRLEAEIPHPRLRS